MGSEGQGRSKLTVLEVWSLHLLPEHHLGKYKLPSPQLLPTFCIRKTESVVQHSVLRSPGNFDSCFCWRTKFWKKDMQTLTESPDSKHFRFYEPRGKRTRTYSLKRESKQHSHMWAHDLFVCLFVCEDTIFKCRATLLIGESHLETNLTASLPSLEWMHVELRGHVLGAPPPPT